MCAVTAVGVIGREAFVNFGGSHTESDIERYAQSGQFDSRQNRFVSERQTEIDAIKDRVFNLRTIYEQLSQGEHIRPVEKLPERSVDMQAFLDDSTAPNIVWLGHSSFMLRIAGKSILIDPVFENAGPLFFLGQRFQASVLAREDVPDIDYVLISHDHYDHLEAATTEHLAGTGTHFIVPIGVGAHLRAWGVPANRYTEHDWWDELTLDDLLIAITPSEHYSGRKGLLANDTLWASFVLKSANGSLYFSGDSGYGEHFGEIARRYGPFDVAFLENGQYSPISREIHMHPEDTVRAFGELDASVLVPIHWAVFSLSRHAWFEPADRVTALAQQNGYAV
ncbi:MAG: MBL fold metallo-hydrolase, partial [Pseudomonadota bacterium]